LTRVNPPTSKDASGRPARAPFFSSRLWTWGLLALIILATAAVRFRLREAPLERDEGEYAYAGQLILQGLPPYQLAYNMKFPGVYVSYAAIMAVFGQSSAGIHLGFMLLNALTILLVYALTTKLADRPAGLVAAALFAYGSLSRAFVGTSAHATHFVVAAALGGLLLLLHGLEKRSLIGLFASGVLLGVSVLMKQHGAFFVGFAGLFLVYRQAVPWQWKPLVRSLAALAAGVALPLLATGLWLWHAGVFAKFWFWTIQYARQYASQNSGLAGVVESLCDYTPALVWISLCIATHGLVSLWRNTDRSRAAFAGGMLVFSILAVFPGFNFWYHYYILPLPALALLTGVTVSSAALWQRRQGSTLGATVPFILFTLALAGGVISERLLFFQCRPGDVPLLVYGPTHPFREAVVVAGYLKAHSAADARIAVLGSEPEIYFYSHRHSATGYIYTYALMEPQPFAARMQQEMISEIEAAHPEYVVWVRVPSSWIPRPDSPTLILDWLQKYLGAGFEAVGAVETSGEQPAYYWDDQARQHLQAAGVLVFRRKT
jgi:4-amino-4-deoxy-L-arabinose transferase-like glycosyltransferase